MDSTVISDAVNLTSRLEGLCKQYGASIVVSEETLNRLEPSVTYSHRFLDRVKVKGKKKAVSIFEIIDEQNPSILNLKKVTKADFEKGVKLYHSGNFTQAAVRFENVLQQDPNDAAASLYLKRAAHFMVNKPLPDWDSSTAMDSK